MRKLGVLTTTEVVAESPTDHLPCHIRSIPMSLGGRKVGPIHSSLRLAAFDKQIYHAVTNSFTRLTIDSLYLPSQEQLLYWNPAQASFSS